MKQLQKGTRIYYTGDMANDEGIGTIIAVDSSRWGISYAIKYDDGRKANIPTVMFSEEYKGHGGTRFVTLEAYNEYRCNQLIAIGFNPEQIEKHKRV